MSRHKHDRRILPVEATEPEAVEPVESVETTAQEAPQSTIPKPPPLVQGMAQAVNRKWGVPLWLTYLAAWTGSKFGTVKHPTGNLCGIKAEGTEQKNEEGMAWFGMPVHGFDRFGWVCSGLALNYSDPVECVRKLKARCPAIDSTDIKLFYKNSGGE